MDFYLDTLLNLPQTTVFTCVQEAGLHFLHLQFTNEGINCPHCQKYLDILHQTRYILVRDLSICGIGVYLRVPRRRFYCDSCQRYSTEQLIWLGKRQLFTERYQEYIYMRVQESTVEQVSRSEQISGDQVQRIFHRLAQMELKKKDWAMPKRLSLDEFSRKKGKGNFATIVIDLDKSSLLEVIDSHKSDNIITVLKQQPQAMRDKVEEVCVDMWGGFPKVIKAVFPNAEISIDRFHVQKLINKVLNKIRLKLNLKGLKNKYLLMKNNRDLTDPEKNDLESLLDFSPSLRIAYELKEELISIYESDITPSSGIKKIKKWLISAKVMFGSATNTLSLHLKEICNYFKNRTTSGVTEGLNTRIKLILRQSYGFKNFDLMREKLLVCLSL